MIPAKDVGLNAETVERRPVAIKVVRKGENFIVVEGLEIYAFFFGVCACKQSCFF